MLARPMVMMGGEHVSASEHDKLREMLSSREAVVAAQGELIGSLQGKIAALESALVNHADEIALLKRKIFGARSERSGTNELQLLLGEILADEKVLQKHLDELRGKAGEGGDAADPDKSTPDEPAKPRPKPKGRRDLSVSNLPRVVVDRGGPHRSGIGGTRRAHRLG